MDENIQDIVVFGDTKLGDIFEQIYTGNQERKEQINQLLEIAIAGVESFQDVSLLSDTLKNLMDAGTKNDDLLIKLTQIIQRMVTSMNKSNGSGEFDVDALDLQKLREEAAAQFDNLREDQPKASKSDD